MFTFSKSYLKEFLHYKQRYCQNFKSLLIIVYKLYVNSLSVRTLLVVIVLKGLYAP